MNTQDTGTPARSFSIKTEVFEGPLDLLLELVEKRKLLINDISLTEVTDEYISHVAHMQELSLPNTAQFVALAATLLLIKSKSLLPVLELAEEEEEAIEDLHTRLAYYKILRDASLTIDQTFGAHVSHERLYHREEKPVFTPDTFTQTDALRDAIRNVLNELPVKEHKPHVQVRKVISLEEMLSQLHDRIEKQMNFTFKELIGDKQERVHVIVGFLAVLESVKQGRVLAMQAERFGDMKLEKSSVSAPKYY